MKEVTDVIEMTIPAKAEYVGVARLATSGVANRMGYSYDDIEDIKVAISEAITNTVTHAYKEGEHGSVFIRIQTYPDRMEIIVIDSGRSFDVDRISKNMKPLNATTSFDQLSEGGLGLFLIDTLMDQVTINNDSGVMVFMTKYLNRDGVEPHADRVYSK